MLKSNTAGVLVNKSSQRIQSLIFMLKKLANAALQKMHCCNAALAVEKLGDRAQLGCNEGPNLLPWINVYLQRGSKPPPLDQRRVQAAHYLPSASPLVSVAFLSCLICLNYCFAVPGCLEA
jgi:hypothetical protein